MFRRLRRFLFRKKRVRNLPTHMISAYVLRQAPEDERLLMMAGVARSPQEARRLMQKHGVTSAAALLDILPAPRPVWRRRLKIIIQRIEGHYHGKALKPRPNRSEINLSYRYRRTK